MNWGSIFHYYMFNSNILHQLYLKYGKGYSLQYNCMVPNIIHGNESIIIVYD